MAFLTGLSPGLFLEVLFVYLRRQSAALVLADLQGGDAVDVDVDVGAGVGAWAATNAEVDVAFIGRLLAIYIGIGSVTALLVSPPSISPRCLPCFGLFQRHPQLLSLSSMEPVPRFLDKPVIPGISADLVETALLSAATG